MKKEEDRLGFGSDLKSSETQQQKQPPQAPQAEQPEWKEEKPSEKEKKASEATDKFAFKDIKQVYKDQNRKDLVVFDGTFNLAIKDTPGKGQFVCIMGPSGCGKSTLLRYRAGLQRPTSGEILIEGRPITPEDHCGMVFQQYSSLENRTVLENVMLPLLIKEVKKSDAEEQAMAWVKLIELEDHKDKYARSPTLSGGQLQRVAIARSLVASPGVLLMDEPFKALDVQLSLHMQDSLTELFPKLPNDPTIILVTHDISEAVYLGQEVIIMKSFPGGIYKRIPIDLPQERNRKLKRDKRFLEYYWEIEDIIFDLKKCA